MALQRYHERRLFPSVVITVDKEEIGALLMGMCVYLELDRKTILDDGLVVYRDGNTYTVKGSTPDLVFSEELGKDVPSELARFVNRVVSFNIDYQIEE